jgi:hypothetical protein
VISTKRLLVLVPLSIAVVTAFWPTEAAAQRRRGPARRVIVSAGYAYRPYVYPYYYDPFWFGWYDYQYRPYPPYGPFGPYGGPYGRFAYEPRADLRIQVTPKQAEVYMDGYLVGIVDDFDGIFQRLRVPLGEHEITIYLNGYRTIREKLLFRPFETYHIKDAMQPLPAGESAEPRPVPSEPPPSERPRSRSGARIPVPAERRDRNAERFGAVSVRVQPADASVFIDGERWEAPAGENRLLVEVSEGTHRIEIRKDGFKPYSSTISVRSGETVPVNVSLPPL